MVAAIGALPKYLTFQLVLVVPAVPSLARTLNKFCFALKNVCPKFILAVGNSHVCVYLFFTMRYVRSSPA